MTGAPGALSGAADLRERVHDRHDHARHGAAALAGRAAPRGAARPEPSPGQLLVKVRACGVCRYCRASRENLCEAARFTGQTLDDGYGEDLLADQRYCLPLSGGGSDTEAAVRLVDSG
jgi:D-arabinose 1-dehydrogenase-like Zn-dependent alcohol dehydrogenase